MTAEKDKSFLLPGLWGILANTFLLEFGYSLVGIFIPLYIFRLTQDLNWVFLFYFLLHLGIVIFVLPGARLVARFGSDRLALAGTVCRALVFLLLLASAKQIWFLLPAALLWSLVIPFYWLPFHLSLAALNEDHRFGQSLAKISFAARLAGSGGPVLGGLIIQSFGFSPLYVLATILLLFSGLPLVFDRYEFKFPEITLKTLKENLSFKKTFRLNLAFFGSGLTSQVYDIAWPLYVFLLIGSYQFLGAITSAGLLASFVLLILAGKMADRFGQKILAYSAGFNFLNLLARPLFVSKMGIFLVDLVYQLAAIFVWLPLDRLMYLTSWRTKRLEFFLGREIVLHGGASLAILMMAAIFNLTGLNWLLLFSLGSLGLIFVWQTGFLKAETRQSVGIVLLDREKKSVLLQLRDEKENIVYAGFWCLPGGKVEIGESPELTARRELAEETGYRASRLQKLAEETYSLPRGEKIIRHIFWAEYDTEQRIVCREGKRMEFVKIEDLAKLKIYPGHEKFCRQVIEKTS